VSIYVKLLIHYLEFFTLRKPISVCLTVRTAYLHYVFFELLSPSCSTGVIAKFPFVCLFLCGSFGCIRIFFWTGCIRNSGWLYVRSQSQAADGSPIQCLHAAILPLTVGPNSCIRLAPHLNPDIFSVVFAPLQLGPMSPSLSSSPRARVIFRPQLRARNVE
jgi:hypothetical protein